MIDTTSEFRRVLSQAGCEKVALELPIRSASVTWNDLGFYLARVDLSQDAYCPNGIFSVSTAVDITRERAIARASFEAVERYCLAAIGAHASSLRIVPASEANLELFRAGGCDRFVYGDYIEAIPARALAAEVAHRFVAVGDAFAPYPRRDGNIGAPSTTNGVACHRTFELACQAAAQELLERHWIMRYWFLDRKLASSIELAGLPVGDWLRIAEMIRGLGYEIKLLRISGQHETPAVLGFVFHPAGSYPAGVCAASLKTSLVAAVESCLLEILQTMTALVFSTDSYDHWLRSGEPFTTLEHNMFGLAKADNALAIRRIIESEIVFSLPEGGVECRDVDLSGLVFADLTRPDWREEVCVVRAVSDQLYKLVVGDHFGEQRLLTSASRLQRPHPFP